MPLQILTLKLDGITAGDYLTWCRDPDPPALDFALRSITVDADALGDTVTAILDWSEPPPAAPAAATTAGLPLSAGVEVYPLHAGTVSAEGRRHLTCTPTAGAGPPSGGRRADPRCDRPRRIADAIAHGG